jgi:hypothetical protein
MAMGETRFLADCNFGHVTTDTIGEGVDGVARGLVQNLMAFETLLRSCP